MEEEIVVQQNQKPKVPVLMIAYFSIAVIILGGVFLYFFVFSKPQSSPQIPSGPFKRPANVVGPTMFKGVFPLMINAKGFSQNMVQARPGSSILPMNLTAKDVIITITDAFDKTINTFDMAAGKSAIPVAYDKPGTYKYKDSSGNTAIVVITDL